MGSGGAAPEDEWSWNLLGGETPQCSENHRAKSSVMNVLFGLGE